jgi:hypothetical protein
LKLHVADKDGAKTAQPVALQAHLTFDDHTPLPDELSANAIHGVTVFTSKGSEGALKLKMNVTSKNVGYRRFRVRISPQDHSLAQERPGLSAFTEPFYVVRQNGAGPVAVVHPPPKPPPKPAASAGSSGPRSAISKQPKMVAPPVVDPLAGGTSKIATAARALVRRRYFPADSIRSATAAPPGAACTVELGRTGVAACDRLAVMVAQQLTQRAWQHARRQRTGAQQLTAADVASVAREGMFDFLYEAGVVSEWIEAPAEPMQQVEGKPGPVDAAPAQRDGVRGQQLVVPSPSAPSTEQPDTGAMHERVPAVMKMEVDSAHDEEEAPAPGAGHQPLQAAAADARERGALSEG